MDGKIFYQNRKNEFEKYNKAKFFLQRPRLVGYYEYSCNKIMPAKRLKYFKELEITDYPLDLNKGEENMLFVTAQPQRSRLSIPLHYAMSMAATRNYDVDLTRVYCSRSVLTQIMGSYTTQYDFSVNVSRYNGSLYMTGSKALLMPKTVQVQHMRLEQMLFTEFQKESTNSNQTLDQNVILSALHRTILGKYDLIYAGVVQGIVADEEFKNFNDLDALNQLRFVFAKQVNYSKLQEWKLLTYWLQAYLANVDVIYLARKTVEGIVNEPIEKIKTSDIPRYCRSWKPQICVGILHDFLEKVEQIMANVNSMYTVYGIFFDAKQQKFYYKVHEGESEMSFISEEYGKFEAK